MKIILKTYLSKRLDRLLLAIFAIVLIVTLLPLSVLAVEVKWVMEPADVGAFQKFSDGVGVFYKNGKSGAINAEGKLTIPYEYDYIYPFYNGLTIADDYSRGSALFDKTGREIIPLSAGCRLFPLLTYRDNTNALRPASDGGMVKAVKYGEDGKYGLFNTAGELITTFIYDKIDIVPDGTDNMAKAFKDGKYGFIDGTGKEVIPCIYLGAENFSEGLAAVQTDGKWGFVNKMGEPVIPFIYDAAVEFNDGLARVYTKAKGIQYINKEGHIVISNFYSGGVYISNDFREGLAPVMIPEDPSSKNTFFIGGVGLKSGYMNKNGKISPFIYDSQDVVVIIGEGIIKVKKDGKSGLMNSNLEEFVPCIYDDISPFSEGLALVVKDGKKGYIDRTGKLIIPCIYDFAYDFKDGLAGVLYDKKFRYIDNTGKTIIDPFFEANSSGFFSEGVAWVQLNGKYGIIENPIKDTAVPTSSNVAPIEQPKTINVGKVERLAGASRYNTAVAISKSGWSQSDYVVLVDGNNFPDALVGSSFAYLKDAPVLITPSDALDNDIRAEIERLGTKTVYILGNNTSVSQTIENDLKQKYNVIRIGGAEVLDTAVKVGDEVRKLKQFDTVAIATQGNFPDALAIAPFSAKNTMPILFSELGRLRTDTKEALQKWGLKDVVIAGGTGVISSAVENELTSMGITVKRLAGQDRYDTALEIIKHFEPQGGYTNISIATGENYPDALTGAVLAAKTNTPLILVNRDSVKSGVADYVNGHTISKAYMFGGSAVISDGVIGK